MADTWVLKSVGEQIPRLRAYGMFVSQAVERDILELTESNPERAHEQ